MRLPPLLPPLILAVSLCACSPNAPSTAGNDIDVGAAASRAQSDIANYAAASKPPAKPAAPPSADPPFAAPTGDPASASAATVIATNATAPVTAALPADAAPEAVVRRYFAAISAGRYAEAWALWDGKGQASGLSEAAFAKSFAPYATYRASVGTAGDVDPGAGQRYVAVPVTVTGTLRSGAPFRLEGPLMLHKVADGIQSDDPEAHAWRLRNSELKPRPAKATDAPS